MCDKIIGVGESQEEKMCRGILKYGIKKRNK